jgi:hypothetical protein
MAETMPVSDTSKEANKKMGDMYAKATGGSVTNSAINRDEVVASMTRSLGFSSLE